MAGNGQGKFVDLVNQRFGKLFVVEPSANPNPSSRRKSKWWKCICDCGEFKVVDSQSLKQNYTKSCGCSTEDYNNSKIKYPKFREISRKLWGELARGAKQRNLELSISPKYVYNIFEQQGRCCSLTKKKLKIGVNASLDRIDSGKGYIKENVQWLDRKVNFMKRNLAQEEFISLCGNVWENRKKN